MGTPTFLIQEICRKTCGFLRKCPWKNTPNWEMPHRCWRIGVRAPGFHEAKLTLIWKRQVQQSTTLFPCRLVVCPRHIHGIRGSYCGSCTSPKFHMDPNRLWSIGKFFFQPPLFMQELYTFYTLSSQHFCLTPREMQEFWMEKVDAF